VLEAVARSPVTQKKVGRHEKRGTDQKGSRPKKWTMTFKSEGEPKARYRSRKEYLAASNSFPDKWARNQKKKNAPLRGKEIVPLGILSSKKGQIEVGKKKWLGEPSSEGGCGGGGGGGGGGEDSEATAPLVSQRENPSPVQHVKVRLERGGTRGLKGLLSGGARVVIGRGRSPVHKAVEEGFPMGRELEQAGTPGGIQVAMERKKKPR